MQLLVKYASVLFLYADIADLVSRLGGRMGDPAVIRAPAGHWFTPVTAWMARERLATWIILLVIDLFVLTLFVFYLDHAAARAPGGVLPPLAWYAMLFREALFAFAIACMLALLSETSLFKAYVETRITELLRASNRRLIKRVDTIAGSHLIERVQDRRFWSALRSPVRDTVEDHLVDLRIPPNDPGELRSLLKVLIRARRYVRVWRSQCTWVLEYDDIPAHPDAFRLTVDRTFHYRNCGERPAAFEHHFRYLCDPVAGIPDDDLNRTELIKVDERNRLAECPQTITHRDGRVEFSRVAALVIPVFGVTGAETTVKERSHTIYHKSVPFWSVNFTPMFEFDLIVNHPATVKPMLYLFGLKTPDIGPRLEPTYHGAKMHHWVYKEWLLRSHAILVSFVPTVTAVSPPSRPT